MSDRLLVIYSEPSIPGDPEPYQAKYRLEIQRSAAGRPGIILTAICDLNGSARAVTVVVDNAHDIIDPILEWLNNV